MKDDRLISLNAAIEALKKAEALVRAFGYHAVIDAIDTLPTVDAVPVVRCKDCKFYHQMTAETGICKLACRHLGNDGFCSEGERYESVES